MSVLIKTGKQVNYYDPREDRAHVIGQIAHDRTIVRFVKEGKGFDKGLQQDVQAIEREAMNKQKEQWYAKKRDKIQELKREGIKLGIPEAIYGNN